MDATDLERTWIRIVAAAVGATAMLLAQYAIAQRLDAEHISVLSDRYVAAGRAFDDLDLLERYVAAQGARAVVLDACGAAATRALRAAVHRFRHLAVDIRARDAGEPMCAPNAPHATRVAISPARPPYGIDDATVDAYWQSLMP